MFAENQSEDFLSDFLYRYSIRKNFHSIRGYGAASERISLHPFYLDQAHAASTERRQVLVIAKGRYIDPVNLGGAKNIHAFRRCYAASVEIKFYRFLFRHFYFIKSLNL
jgi:hypothetical protein